MEKINLMLGNFNFFIAITIFISYIIIDGLYVKYTIEVVSLNRLKSAFTGSGIHFLLAYGVLNYTKNWLYIFPLVFGSFIGTYLVVKYEKKKQTK